MARLDARMRRRMSIKKNRFKSPQQEEAESLEKAKPKKKKTTAKIKRRVYQKKDNSK